jgi:hypothetical protein
LTLTTPTSGGRSVGIVRSRTKATELLLLFQLVGSHVDIEGGFHRSNGFYEKAQYNKLITAFCHGIFVIRLDALQGEQGKVLHTYFVLFVLF